MREKRLKMMSKLPYAVVVDRDPGGDDDPQQHEDDRLAEVRHHRQERRHLRLNARAEPRATEPREAQAVCDNRQPDNPPKKKIEEDEDEDEEQSRLLYAQRRSSSSQEHFSWSIPVYPPSRGRDCPLPQPTSQREKWIRIASRVGK